MSTQEWSVSEPDYATAAEHLLDTQELPDEDATQSTQDSDPYVDEDMEPLDDLLERLEAVEEMLQDLQQELSDLRPTHQTSASQPYRTRRTLA